jgi:glycosyltransferase involved in cell wall biosynthesis
MSVSLVIPGRNCGDTIGACLEAVTPMLERPETQLREVVFVDDGSTDDTADVVRRFPIRYIRGDGSGPGAARNAGWRVAESDLIWFVDSDCVPEPDTLARLLPQMADPAVAGVGGSYGNMNEQSLLACVIHEEIIQRHLAMPERVNFLATFNVVYRRDVLADVGGFDERYLKAQDAELAFRIVAAGHTLAFERDARVRHFHEMSLRPYLRTQRQQGFWRVWLHAEHTGHAAGNAYSNIVDHAQPPLAVLTLLTLPLLILPGVRWIPAACLLILLLASLPMTTRLVSRTRRLRYLAFAPMSVVRALWRGVGMVQGMASYLLRSRRASCGTPRTGGHPAR